MQFYLISIVDICYSFALEKIEPAAKIDIMKYACNIILLIILSSLSLNVLAQHQKDTTKLIDKLKDIPQVVVRKSNKEFTIKGNITDKLTK